MSNSKDQIKTETKFEKIKFSKKFIKRSVIPFYIESDCHIFFSCEKNFYRFSPKTQKLEVIFSQKDVPKLFKIMNIIVDSSIIVRKDPYNEIVFSQVVKSGVYHNKNHFGFDMDTKEWRRISYGGYESELNDYIMEYNSAFDEILLFGGYYIKARFESRYSGQIFNFDERRWKYMSEIEGKDDESDTKFENRILCSFDWIEKKERKFWIMGGIVIGTSLNLENDPFTAKKRVESNDIVEINLDSYSSKYKILSVSGLKPLERYGHASAIHNKKFYIFGGKSKHCQECFNDLFVLNMSNMKWREIEIKGFIPKRSFSPFLVPFNDGKGRFKMVLMNGFEKTGSMFKTNGRLTNEYFEFEVDKDESFCSKETERFDFIVSDSDFDFEVKFQNRNFEIFKFLVAQSKVDDLEQLEEISFDSVAMNIPEEDILKLLFGMYFTMKEEYYQSIFNFSEALKLVDLNYFIFKKVDDLDEYTLVSLLSESLKFESSNRGGDIKSFKFRTSFAHLLFCLIEKKRNIILKNSKCIQELKISFSKGIVKYLNGIKVGKKIKSNKSIYKSVVESKSEEEIVLIDKKYDEEDFDSFDWFSKVNKRYLFRTKKFFNLVLRSKDRRKIYVHREVLIFRSNFFFFMLKFKGVESESTVVEMEYLNYKELYAIVEFIYLNEISISDIDALKNVLEHTTMYFETEMQECTIKRMKEVLKGSKISAIKFQEGIDDKFLKHFRDFILK